MENSSGSGSRLNTGFVIGQLTVLTSQRVGVPRVRTTKYETSQSRIGPSLAYDDVTKMAAKMAVMVPRWPPRPLGLVGRPIDAFDVTARDESTHGR